MTKGLNSWHTPVLIASDVDLPGRKPNCDDEIIENLSKNASMRLKMDLSNIFLRKGKTDIRR